MASHHPLSWGKKKKVDHYSLPWQHGHSYLFDQPSTSPHLTKKNGSGSFVAGTECSHCCFLQRLQSPPLPVPKQNKNWSMLSSLVRIERGHCCFSWQLRSHPIPVAKRSGCGLIFSSIAVAGVGMQPLLLSLAAAVPSSYVAEQSSSNLTDYSVTGQGRHGH